MYAKRNVPKQTSMISAMGLFIGRYPRIDCSILARCMKKPPAGLRRLTGGRTGTTWGFPPRPCATTWCNPARFRGNLCVDRCCIPLGAGLRRAGLPNLAAGPFFQGRGHRDDLEHRPDHAGRARTDKTSAGGVQCEAELIAAIRLGSTCAVALAKTATSITINSIACAGPTSALWPASRSNRKCVAAWVAAISAAGPVRQCRSVGFSSPGD
jgi:hypothetical protein